MVYHTFGVVHHRLPIPKKVGGGKQQHGIGKKEES
jgi:hypothetical protein